MNIKQNGKIDIFLLIKSILLQSGSTVLFIALFAVVMLLCEIDNKFAPIFASVAVGIGAFTTAFFVSSKKKEKGYLYGILIGTITFILITLIGLIIGNGRFSINTLFHFIIINLSSVVGGIMGVDKKGEKYI